MRSFPLFDFQIVVLLSFLGLIALLLLYIALTKIAIPPVSRRGRQESEQFSEQFPDGIETSQGPIPLILIFVYAGFFVWALAYVIILGIRSEPF